MMITEQRKHKDAVLRRQYREMIENGTQCIYYYTHYAPNGDHRDEWKDITKEEALTLLAERNDKRDDGYRFSPSRCFLQGNVIALRRPDNPDIIYIKFGEADRKPTFEEIIANSK